MLTSKNRLIHPQHFKDHSTKEGDDFYYRSYLNALQYYMDDPTADLENISFASMFLYSMGDENILHSPELKRDGFGDLKLSLPTASVKKDISFYSKKLVSALQFRLQDRQFVLDINTYKSDVLKDFLNVDVQSRNDNEHSLFQLMMRNFSLKYFRDVGEKKYATLLDKLNDSVEKEFTGIYDEKDFQERYAKENDSRQILELDGYFKTELKEWQIKHERKSLVDANSFDTYPYIDGILYDNNKYFIAIALTPKDENYIDEKTEEINKVFECSIFIYENDNEQIKQSYLNEFKNGLNFYLGRLVNNCSLYKLQEAMNGAIGEAAGISRHWYSKGLDGLFNKETRAELENNEDSIEFYTKFIKELLCKIEGVENTEIYPFDRVFIFPETGLERDYDGMKHIRVLEAKIKSREPFDRGSYLMGWEQDVEDIDGNKVLDEDNDLIFSDKKVNYMDWNLQSSSVFEETIAPVDRDHIRGNLLLSNLLLENNFLSRTIKDKTTADNKKLVNMRRKIRDEFNEYGLFYEYEFGLSLKDQYPVLLKLQNEYFEHMSDEKHGPEIAYDHEDYNQNFVSAEDAKRFYSSSDLQCEKNEDKNKVRYYRGNSKQVLISKMRKNIEEEYKAKTITVCFDPERITKPELSEAVQYLGRKDSITMVFVADKDFVKTTSELEAEVEDFKVLIQMVIRQVIYDTENEAKRAEVKKQVHGLIPHTIHEIKSLIKDKTVLDRVDTLISQLNAQLSTEEYNNFNEFKSDNVYNQVLYKLLENNKSTFTENINLNSIIQEWLPKNHLISTELYDGFLPKMKILWEDLAIPKAFKVLLKNATEYCHMRSQVTQNGKLTLSLVTENIDGTDFLVINIINTTPSLTKSRFDDLNNETKDELGKDKNKVGSTGIGVVQARRQIKSISSSNNIIYTMLSSNIISAKMYLKIEIIPENNLFLEEIISSQETDPTVEVHTQTSSQCDVLYFEDSQKYYEENIALLSTYNISIQHNVRKDATYMKNAKVLLTDMSILDQNDIASKEEGLDGILMFKEHNQNDAPICVLSNALAKEIKEDILTHLDDMIEEKNIVIIKDFNEVIEIGKIYILNNVKTLDSSHNIIFDFLKSIESVEQEQQVLINKTPANYELATFRDKQEYHEDFHQMLTNMKYSISDDYFYAATSSNTQEALPNILSKWQEYKVPRVGKGERKFTISNVTYHKNILLILDDITLEDKRERWWLFYLGITHNIIFNFINAQHSDLIPRWSEFAIKRESSGYLGKLRHDIKNYQKIYEKVANDMGLDKEFVKIVHNTLELQKLLQLGKYQSLKHYSLIPDIEKLKKNALVADKEDILKYANDVENTTLDIDTSLKKIIKILEDVASDDTNLNNLKLFSKLINFNIDFCKTRD